MQTLARYRAERGYTCLRKRLSDFLCVCSRTVDLEVWRSLLVRCKASCLSLLRFLKQFMFSIFCTLIQSSHLHMYTHTKISSVEFILQPKLFVRLCRNPGELFCFFGNMSINCHASYCIPVQICWTKHSLFLIGICTASTPFVLLGDVLDCLPLDQCDKIFTFVEKNVATWKSVSIFPKCMLCQSFCLPKPFL